MDLLFFNFTQVLILENMAISDFSSACYYDVHHENKGSPNPEFFRGGGGRGRSHCVKLRVHARFVMSTSHCVLLYVTFFYVCFDTKQISNKWAFAGKNEDIFIAFSLTVYWRLFA